LGCDISKTEVDPFVSAKVVETLQSDYFPAAAPRDRRFSTPPLDFDQGDQNGLAEGFTTATGFGRWRKNVLLSP